MATLFLPLVPASCASIDLLAASLLAVAQNMSKATVNASNHPMQLTALNAFSMPSNRNDKHDTHATWIRLHAHDCRDPTLPKTGRTGRNSFYPSLSLNNTEQSTLFQSTVMRVMKIDAKNHRQLWRITVGQLLSELSARMNILPTGIS